MPEVVPSEQQRILLDFDRVTTMRVYVTATAKRVGVVRGGGLCEGWYPGDSRQGVEGSSF
eukprot:1667233-Pyramimonas_sp.AAC.1